MTRRSVAVLAATAALAGCGGGDSAAPPTATTPTSVSTATVQSPTPGCDVVVVCVPQVAHELLARCPARSLDADGRHARKRLENLLEQIEHVDLHNKQAYEADETAQQALTELEQACNA